MRKIVWILLLLLVPPAHAQWNQARELPPSVVWIYTIGTDLKEKQCPIGQGSSFICASAVKMRDKSYRFFVFSTWGFPILMCSFYPKKGEDGEINCGYQRFEI